jgi:hypothetical protein
MPDEPRFFPDKQRQKQEDDWRAQDRKDEKRRDKERGYAQGGNAQDRKDEKRRDKERGYAQGGNAQAKQKRYAYGGSVKTGIKPTNQGTAKAKGMGAATRGGNFKV